MENALQEYYLDVAKEDLHQINPNIQKPRLKKPSTSAWSTSAFTSIPMNLPKHSAPRPRPLRPNRNRQPLAATRRSVPTKNWRQRRHRSRRRGINSKTLPKLRLLHRVNSKSSSSGDPSIMIPRTRTKSLSGQEPFMIWMKAALIAGFVIASPWVFYQLWMFVAAGLYPTERKYVHVFLPFSIGLFLFGVVCSTFVFPPILKFFLSFNRSMGIEPEPRISEWLSFVLFLPLGFGLTFQLPLVMLFLERIGVMTVRGLPQTVAFRGARHLDHRRHRHPRRSLEHLPPRPSANPPLLRWRPPLPLVAPRFRHPRSHSIGHAFQPDSTFRNPCVVRVKSPSDANPISFSEPNPCDFLLALLSAIMFTIALSSDIATSIADDSPSLSPKTDGEFVIGPDYTPAPELAAKDGRPQRHAPRAHHEIRGQQIFPGIKGPYTRGVHVYVPAQYVADSEPPFLIVQDGKQQIKRLPPILDNLIADHRIPALIAIMVDNGGGDGRGSERGLEYDTVSGKYAEFIETEVLPLVENQCNVKLTKDPEGRATMGGSSGAAAAFTMAWFHPEWYHRVISYSGTFVNQQSPENPASPKGAWEYPEYLVPKRMPGPSASGCTSAKTTTARSSMKPRSTTGYWPISTWPPRSKKKATTTNTSSPKTPATPIARSTIKPCPKPSSGSGRATKRNSET